MYVINIQMTAENIQFTKIEIQIAKHLFKHYKERHNARQLARTLDINHAHANKLCNILLEKRLLVKEDIGNSTYFSYNYEDKLAVKFIEYLLSLEEKEFPKWLAVILHSLQKFKPYIQIGLVFGSSIKKSDFDKVIISPGPGIAVEAGDLNAFLKKYYKTKSILGICLGHEAIAELFGAKLVKMPEPWHGIQGPGIVIKDDVLFKGLPSQFSI